MVDNNNPTNQFHPYTPVDAIPNSERPTSGLNDLLRKVGMGSAGTVKMRESVDKFRGYAQKNPSAVLGGLAALAIGLGMMRRRGTR